jgi:hypothetical protein
VIVQTLLPFRCCFGRERCFFEWPPFEIFLISPAHHIALVALLAGWFCLVAFQSFCLASDTAYRLLSAYMPSMGIDGVVNCLSAYHNQDKTYRTPEDIPLRLFDCLGFVIPAPLTKLLDEGFAAVDGRLGAVLAGLIGGGGGEEWATGEFRNADGEGIVIASIRRSDL